MKSLFRYLPPLLFAVYLFTFYALPVNLVVTDLGRHIANGMNVIAGNWDVLYTNFYSYTQPEHGFINHHWATGVAFYLVHQLVGFTGLHLLYILTMLLAAALIIFSLPTPDRRVGMAVAIILTPLLAYRTEIRPEGFSYLLMAISYFSLTRFTQDKWSFRKIMLILFPIQILWVNLHIFWIMGPAFAGLFLFHATVVGDKLKVRPLILLSIVLVVCSFVNPFGINGVMAPFNILNEYGYMVAENQSLMFMYQRTGGTDLLFFAVIGFFSVMGGVWLTIKNRWKENLVPILLSLGFFGLGIFVIRGIALFAFMSIPLFVVVITGLINTHFLQTEKMVRTFIIGGACMMVVVGFFTRNSMIGPLRYYQIEEKGKVSQKFHNKLGLQKGIHGSVDFFKKAKLPGPIFNNYDIGSFLIYGLPDQRVFVDNRPEAYSVPFFKEIYQPMQEDPAVWETMSIRYGIQSIFFNRHDNTPWGQDFLIRVVKDPNWVPIYVDAMTIILLKNTPENLVWIDQYRLPDSMFGAKPN